MLELVAMRPIEVSPPHRMIYSRSGNLAVTTQLDQKKADDFMRKADIRRDIVIVDSDTPAENNAMPVSSDTLAFRLIEPIHKLTEVHFHPKPFHSLVRRHDHFELQVLERTSDDKIRSGHPIDQSDYNKQFLGMLNGAVSAGTAEILTSEKLGIHDQFVPYTAESLYSSALAASSALNGENPLKWSSLILILVFNIGFNSLYHVVNNSEVALTANVHTRRDIASCLIPLPLPAERWIYGQYYLARHGDQMVISKPLQGTTS